MLEDKVAPFTSILLPYLRTIVVPLQTLDLDIFVYCELVLTLLKLWFVIDLGASILLELCSCYLLLIVSPVQRSRWINLYKDWNTHRVHCPCYNRSLIAKLNANIPLELADHTQHTWQHCSPFPKLKKHMCYSINRFMLWRD